MDIKKFYSIQEVRMFHRECVNIENSERAAHIEDTAIGASTVMSGPKLMNEATENLRRRL